MNQRREAPTFWCVALIAATALGACAKSGNGSYSLVILHTNDLHSYLNGHDPEADYTPLTINDDSTVGGMARLASLVASERMSGAMTNTPVLLLDAGDFMMGTPFEILGLSKSVELVEMAKIGYDAIDLGNHEFDWTPRALAGFIAAAAAGGFRVPLLASNMKYSAVSPDDDDLQRLELAGYIQRKTVKTLPNGIKVGIFGVLGQQAVMVTPQVAPLTFDAPKVTAKAMVDELRNVDKVDIVILLSHSGTDASGKGEDAQLAQDVPGIDIIVSGHTHVALPQPVQVGNTLVVQTGAYAANLGRLELSVVPQSSPSFSVKSYRLIPIDDTIPGDAPTQARIDGYVANVDALLMPVGFAYKKVIGETSFDLPRQTPNDVPRPGFAESVLGNLVTDSYRMIVNAVQPSDGPVDLAVESSGNIRVDVQKGKTGVIWFADLFRVLPLGIGPTDQQPGYPLVSFFLNGRDLKAGMEVTASSMDPLANNDYFLQISGGKMTYNSAGQPFNRVTSLVLDGNRPVNFADTTTCYKVVTTYYVASLLGLVSQFTGGQLSVVPKTSRACNTPLTDMTCTSPPSQRCGLSSRIVNANPLGTFQELKQWGALVTYVSRFASLPSSGPVQYSQTEGRIVRQ